MQELGEQVLERARRAWPGAAWQREDLERRLAASDPQLWSASAAAVRGDELLLAWACLLGDRDAIRQVESRYVLDVLPNLRALGLAAAELDDVVQTLRVALLVGAPGGEPKLARYTGRGELGGFVRTVAVRLALDRKRARQPVALDDLARRLITPLGDPDVDYQKDLYTERFAEALAAAWACLPTAERLLLRYHLLDEVSIDELAVIYRIHRSTAARRCVSARQRLIAGTRAELGRAIGVSTRTVDSILRLIATRLDAGLRTLPGEHG
jgi:RNA polymerase sigma-70 factor (ECF subfamily)